MIDSRKGTKKNENSTYPFPIFSHQVTTFFRPTENQAFYIRGQKTIYNYAIENKNAENFLNRVRGPGITHHTDKKLTANRERSYFIKTWCCLKLSRYRTQPNDKLKRYKFIAKTIYP